MAVIPMTTKWIHHLSLPSSGWDEYRDKDCKGLILRVSAKGTKTWYLMYRTSRDRNPKRYKLGRYPNLTLRKAREEAGKSITTVLNGNDPAYDRQQKLKCPTIKEMAKAYIEQELPEQRASRESRRILEKEIIPAWGSIVANDLTRFDINRKLKPIAQRAPVMANRVLGKLRSLFNWAQSQEIVDANPCTRLPAPTQEKPRDRVLSTEEIRRFWEVTEAHINVTSIRALRLVLVTAQRPGEVAGMAWREIDDNWWTIPAERSKNGLAQRVPLNEMAKEVLRQCTQDSPFVFPRRIHLQADGSMSRLTMSHTVRRYNDEWGIPRFTPHDLRRTAASHMASAGVSRLVISKILNHMESGITAVYDRHSYDQEKQQAMATWEQKLRSILTGEKAEVVHLMKG
jgi:integrase